jgi:hypothetical protein
MGRLLTGAALATLAVTMVAASAEAAPFKKCGNAGTMYGGEVKLTNVQAKQTTCKKAKRFVRTYTKKSGEETGFRCSEDFYCMWRGWSCRNDGRDSGRIKHRCETIDTQTHRLKVVKWVDRFAPS